MYIVHCELYIVHCTLYIVHCTLYIVHCTLYIVHCTLYIVHCTLYIVHCTMYNVHCTLYTAHCSLYLVHCTLYMHIHNTDPGYIDRRHTRYVFYPHGRGHSISEFMAMCAVASSISWLSCATHRTQPGALFFLVARATRTPPRALSAPRVRSSCSPGCGSCALARSSACGHVAMHWPSQRFSVTAISNLQTLCMSRWTRR